MDKAEDIISELFGAKLDGKLSGVPKILKNWPEILTDSRLADHCRLEDLTDNKLVVSFDHQGWIQVFKMHQARILRNLSQYTERGGKITSVKMIMRADVSSYKKNKVNSVQPKETSEKENYQVPKSLDSIEDNELKRGLENLRKKLEGK